MSERFEEVTKVSFVDGAGNIIEKYAFQGGAGGRVIEVIEENMPGAQIIEIIEGDIDDVPGASTVATLTGALAISDEAVMRYSGVSMLDPDLAILGEGETEILIRDPEATSVDAMVYRADADQGDYLL